MQYRKYGVSSLYGTWIEYLAKEIIGIIDNRKKQLPLAAQNIDGTQVYWVEPVLHVNLDLDSRQRREKFGNCLDAVSKIYDNMTTTFCLFQIPPNPPSMLIAPLPIAIPVVGHRVVHKIGDLC